MPVGQVRFLPLAGVLARAFAALAGADAFAGALPDLAGVDFAGALTAFGAGAFAAFLGVLGAGAFAALGAFGAG